MKFFRSNTTPASDEELLDCFRQSGQSEYFGELYDRYIPLIYGLCLKYLKDSDRADDAVMQLFEDLLNKIAGYEIKTFRTWIHSVARNHCLQTLRKKDPTISLDFTINFMESEDEMHLFDEQTDETHLKYLSECMEKLPEPQKISIQQFFIDERSYAEVAEHTGYDLKSVKSYIQNGKRNLKICIESKIRK